MRRAVIAIVAGSTLAAGCSSDSGEGPSIAEGGLPVYSIGAPDDLDVDVVAEQLRAALDLEDETQLKSRGPDQARIEGADHTAVVMDRGAGSVIVSYSGPRFGNPGCVKCPPLDESDTFDGAMERSAEILDAIGVDLSNVEFSEGLSTDVEIRVIGDVAIEGAVIDDLRFLFVWTQGGQLNLMTGGLFDVEVIGTVAGRGEVDARAQAETMIGSERSITEFEVVYTGGFRDGELVVAPAYLATTDLGTTFSVSAFEGDLPG